MTIIILKTTPTRRALTAVGPDAAFPPDGTHWPPHDRCALCGNVLRPATDETRRLSCRWIVVSERDDCPVNSRALLAHKACLPAPLPDGCGRYFDLVHVTATLDEWTEITTPVALGWPAPELTGDAIRALARSVGWWRLRPHVDDLRLELTPYRETVADPKVDMGPAISINLFGDRGGQIVLRRRVQRADVGPRLAQGELRSASWLIYGRGGVPVMSIAKEGYATLFPWNTPETNNPNVV